MRLKMTICPNCGIEVSGEDEYCRKCGFYLKKDTDKQLSSSDFAKIEAIKEKMNALKSMENYALAFGGLLTILVGTYLMTKNPSIFFTKTGTRWDMLLILLSICFGPFIIIGMSIRREYMKNLKKLENGKID